MAALVPAIPEKSRPPSRMIPWPVLGASLAAMAMLSITSESIMPLILAVSVFSATLLLCMNPAMTNWSRWIMRPVILIATFIKLVSAGFRLDRDWMLDPFLLSGVGIFLCGELGFQIGRAREDGKNAVPSLIMLSGLIAICGAFTRDLRYIPILTPVYFFFLVLTLIRHSSEERVQVGINRKPTYVRLGVLASIALLQGFVFYFALFTYRIELTNAFLNLVRNYERSAETGLPEVPYLRSTSEMSQSRKRVFKVIGDIKDAHFRAVAYNSYANGTWRPQPATRTMEMLALPALNPKAEGERLRIERYPDRGNILCAPLHTAGISPDQPIQLQYPRYSEMSGPLQLVTPSNHEEIFDIILNDNPEHQGLFCKPRRGTDATPGGLPHSLYSTLTVDPKVAELGREITKGLADPRDKIRAILHYLHTNHRYSLSIEVPYPVGNDHRTDPISVFLLQKKDGFCEYFASAAVMLLRASGVPSRYVQGYYVHEKRLGGAYIARARDAHAWAESWIDGVGWVVVEATPGSGTPDATNNPGTWERISEWLSETWEEFKTWMAEGGWQKVFFGGIALLTLAGLYNFWKEWRKGSRRAENLRFNYTSPDQLFVEFRKRFEKVMGTRATVCPPSRTWDEHLDALEQEFKPDPKPFLDRAREFVRVYNAARFKPGGAQAELRTLDELLLQLETSK